MLLAEEAWIGGVGSNEETQKGGPQLQGLPGQLGRLRLNLFFFLNFLKQPVLIIGNKFHYDMA